MTSRRDLLLALGASALAPSLLRANERAHLNARGAMSTPAVGTQLYVMRKQMFEDPEGTIARIAQLGYAEIEWWGTWARTPAQLRAMLDANGLRSPSLHVGASALKLDQLPALLDRASAMGHTTLIIASLEANERDSEDKWKAVANLLNEAARTASAHGIRTGYHNHGGEFTRFDTRNAYEILHTETDPTLVDFQLDAYWALRDGFDPLTLYRQHADRITTLHLKDAAPAPPHAQVELGDGIIDWPGLIREGASHRVKSLFLDIDDPADAWATADSARRHLRSLGY